MKKLKDLQMALCQMKVVLGQPAVNVAFMMKEIIKAEQKGMDLIIFPEMCVTGYLIGDMYEDQCFVNDVVIQTERLCRLTTDLNIAVIFGSLTSIEGIRGEDGRNILFNTALVIQGGEIIGKHIKVLQPNYRIFDDDRHFYSSRKLMSSGSHGVRDDLPQEYLGYDYSLKPISVVIGGEKISLGVMVCEDMWHKDYPLSPARELVKNGAEILINISASPWTWQKNAKRDLVVRDILKESPVPFVYVNNTGIQNNGKNIIIFDGSSTVYNSQGRVIHFVGPYCEETSYFRYCEDALVTPFNHGSDTSQMYKSLLCAIKESFNNLAPGIQKKVCIGLSGGIDSAVDVVLLTMALGKENVIAINMPSRHNSETTQSVAEELASNLGISYEVESIQVMVDTFLKQLGGDDEDISYENVQARMRMEILAKYAQDNNCVFVCNSNKVEVALGYGTLYGDIAGFIMPLGDLVKREVYELANYLNNSVLKRMVIPEACFTMKPSAELKDNQVDPFDYGNLIERGYHDEMVRAFTEFRLSPEWFLDNYQKGTLEEELKLTEGKLLRLFPDVRDFVEDLEKNWRRFHYSYFKRIQAPPIPIISKRAFGYDLRESITEPYYTQRYLDIKKKLLQDEKKDEVAIFGGSFNPPTATHIRIVKVLTKIFDCVIVVPCGGRPEKELVDSGHRKVMIKMAFGDIEKVKIDFFDIDTKDYTPAYMIDSLYTALYPGSEIWHVFGSDVLPDIRQHWQKGKLLWNSLNFMIVERKGYSYTSDDLPPSSQTVAVANCPPYSSTEVRKYIAEGKDFNGALPDDIKKYLKDNGLYEKSFVKKIKKVHEK